MFSSKTVVSDLTTTFGVSSLLVIVKLRESEEDNVASEDDGVTIILSSDSYAVSSIPEILKVAVTDPDGIVKTGFKSNFLSFLSSLSQAYNTPLLSRIAPTCLNWDSLADPSTYP